MKAISIRQPWAQLILSGKKKIDLRSWSTEYRGPLIVHASKTIEEEACLRFNLQPSALPKGVLLGWVMLDKIERLDPETYKTQEQLHLSSNPYSSPIYGWFFSKPQLFDQPRPYTGRIRFFDVPDEIDLGMSEVNQSQKQLTKADQIDTQDPQYPFTLMIKKAKPSSPSSASPNFSLILHQHYFLRAEKKKIPSQHIKTGKIARLNGLVLRVVFEDIINILKKSGYQAPDFFSGQASPLQLNEEDGVYLGLLMLATEPITKIKRLEEIAQKINLMTHEERYYWYSKCTQNGTGIRAQKAIRILLSDE